MILTIEPRLTMPNNAVIYGDLQVQLPTVNKILDITVSDPAAPLYRDMSPTLNSVRHADATNNRREQEKIAHYTPCLTNIVQNGHFVPFAVEATGRIGPAALSFLQELCPPDARGLTPITTLINHIGTVIAKSNAQATAYLMRGAIMWTH
jgi:hypothetical protein